MEVILGLCAAIAYGAGDFAGGLVSRRANVLIVVALSQVIGSTILIPAIIVVGGELTTSAMGWGAVSGIAGGVGVILLYTGLSRGRMSVVAPITAVLAAIVPVGFGLVTGERPSPLALIGVVIALGSVGLVSAAPDPGAPGGGAGTDDPDIREQPSSGIAEALGAGVGFGFFFVALAEAGSGSGLYPILFARIGSLLLVGAIIFFRHPSRTGMRESLPGIAVAGTLDVAANVLYLLATRQGLLSLVAVLTSMYPATTVLLARTVLSERLARTQAVGLVLATAAVALIATG
ncbi:MAG: DMT family transporter [Actinobacteria bacterium]|nr:DMT family transporter [Actinomycetota bacterium]